jgi:hypothetical protein
MPAGHPLLASVGFMPAGHPLLASVGFTPAGPRLTATVAASSASAGQARREAHLILAAKTLMIDERLQVRERSVVESVGLRRDQTGSL